MSAETRLADLRLQERDLLNTLCAQCGHRLGNHSRLSQNCSGHPLDKSWCKCKGFQDPGERLALGESGSCPGLT